MSLSARRTRTTARAILVLVALVHAWATRFSISPDGLSYLDLADAWGDSDDATLANAYWSPAYPFALAVGLSTLVPTPAWESILVRAIDVGVFVAALLAFELFWSTVSGTFRRGLLDEGPPDEAAWWALGYSLFGASCLALTNLVETTPDLLSAVWIFLAAAIAWRLAHSPGLATVSTGVGLGWVLGAGYLTKLALLGPGLVTLGLLAVRRRTRAAALGGVIGLAMLVLPWILLLFLETSRWTLGDAGRLNVAWYVLDEGGGQHWRGEGALHPTRLLHEDPPVHGFAGPVDGVYPPWLDPAYWHEGLVLRFEPVAHLRVALDHLGVLALGWWLPHGLLWAAILGLAWRGRRSNANRALVTVAKLAMLGYLLVHVELRFFGPWAVLLGAGLVGSAGLRDGAERRLVALAVLGAALPIAWTTATLVSKHRDAVLDPGFGAHHDLHAAEALERAGLRRDDGIAVVGYPMDAYWARLAGARIVADVFARPDLPDGTTAVERYWALGPAERAAVHRAFAAEGARVAVTRERDLPAGVDPAGPATAGWRPLDATGFFVHPLPTPP